MNLSIDVETHVVVMLQKVAIGDTMSIIVDLYRFRNSVVFVIAKECCEATKIHLKPSVIDKLTNEQILDIS